MKRPLCLRFCLLTLLSAAACTPAPNILPTNDLNRPADMTFMCLGAFGTPGTDADGGETETGPFTVSGRPMRNCHVPAIDGNVQTQPAVSKHNRTYAFVPNSASGDLSVIDADTWKLVDMDKSTSGYGRVPVGSLPEQISSTTDGCRLMTANRGSCDLTLVDPSALLASTFAANYNSPTVDISIPSGTGLQRVTPRLNGKALDLAPHEAVFLPRDTSGMDAANNLCPGVGGTLDEPYRALVTYPSCDLVALVDLPSGDILTLAQVQDGTKLTPITEIPASCRADCGAGRGPSDAGTSDADMSDGGSTDDGGSSDGGPSTDSGGTGGTTTPPASPGTYGPTSIVIFPRGNQAYISLSRASAVLSLMLTPSSFTPLKNVVLNDAKGSNRIRLGVDPWADPNNDYPGQFVGNAQGRNYLYVIARDGSLRVVDVHTPGNEQECETNFDPLAPEAVAANLSADMACIPYGKYPRRPASVLSTPGLRFPALPVDVAAADLTGTNQEDTVNGGYAWVLTTSGTIYLVNITPQQRLIRAVVHTNQDTLFGPSVATEPFEYKDGLPYVMAAPDVNNLVKESLPFPNQPRDRNVMSYAVSLDGTLGPTRLDLPPLQVTSGPFIEPLWTMGTEQDATALDVRPRQTYVFFPDRNAAVQQGWDVTWQGTVMGARYSGILNGNVLKDGGGQFCTSGVLTGDIVTLRGCTTDADCPLGLVCNRDQSMDQVPGGYSVTGLCMSANLIAANGPSCADLVSSVRRYEISKSSEGQLTLDPHLDEVVRSSLSPCTPMTFGGSTGTGGMGGAAGTGGAAGNTGGAGGIAGGTGGNMSTGGTGGSAGTGAGGGAGAAGTGGAAGTTGTGGMADDGCHDPTDNSTTLFKCVVHNGEPRCLNPCVQNGDCRHGRVCLATCTSNEQCASSSVCDTATHQCHARRPPPPVACTENAECESGMCVKDTKKCKPAFDPNGCNAQPDCLPGEACVAGQCELQSFCADGPKLDNDACFPQLASYQINMNAGFLVTGSSSGSYLYGSGREGPNGCEPVPLAMSLDSRFANRDPRLVSRIPLRPYPNQDLVTNPISCGDPQSVFPTLKTAKGQESQEGFYIDRFDPALEPTDDGQGSLDLLPGGARQEAPQLVEWMQAWSTDLSAPNACLYMGGPIPTDTIATPPYTPNEDPNTRASRPQHVRARFRNTQVSFVLANIDRAPPSSLALHFDVHGGFRQASVVNLTTVQVSAPARLVLGPINSTRIDNVPMKAAPFFFVVDQRRLGTGQGGGPTRGQIVRVNPFGLASTNGYLPVYEDYHASNGLFPIQ